MESASYPFVPLKSPTTEIRLVRFLKSGSTLGLLERFTLGSSECPKYIALSYAWGENRFSQEIIINGHKMSVLEDLAPLLDIICSETHLRENWWWIDSICINQSDDEVARIERNAQVDNMGKIYKNAVEVMGWLGQGDAECEIGMQFMQALSRHKSHLRKRGDVSLVRSLGNEVGNPKKWAALEKLLLTPWWTRVWTLQEYIVAVRFTFRYGRQSTDRQVFMDTISVIDIWLKNAFNETLISSRAFHSVWVRRRILHLYRGTFSMTLLALMAYGGNSKASDPRDRIYSLLGLASDQSMIGSPIYEHDVCKVFTDLVISFVKYYNNLDILCFAGLFTPSSVDTPKNNALPTWVPDWRTLTMPSVMPLMVSQSPKSHIGNCRAPPDVHNTEPTTAYSAGDQDGNNVARFSTDLRTLTCQGLRIDFVDGIGGLKIDHGDKDNTEYDWNRVYDCVYSSSSINKPTLSDPEMSPKLEPDIALQLMKHICLCLLLGRKDRYLRYASPFGYLLDEFYALCIAALRNERLHPRFLDWFQRNKNLHIQGYTFEEICLAASLPEGSNLVDLTDMSNLQSFLSRFTDTTKWMSRRLMTTINGQIGMVSSGTQKGDQIWILLGCSVPVILRNADDTGKFEFVGECFLHEYMQGLAGNNVRNGTVKLEDICLV